MSATPVSDVLEHEGINDGSYSAALVLVSLSPNKKELPNKRNVKQLSKKSKKRKRRGGRKTRKGRRKKKKCSYVKVLTDAITAVQKSCDDFQKAIENHSVEIERIKQFLMK